MSKNTTEDSIIPHSALLGLFLGSISLITIVMNILVLCAVKTEKKLQTVGNLYIVSLSIADLIVGAAVMPLNIVYLLRPGWSLGLPACLFWLSMDYVASTASIFNLFILCIDRYRSVQQPLKYLKYRTKMRASLMILGVWLLSFMWVIPILGWHVFANNGERKLKEKKCETEFSEVTWFKVLTAIVNFYLPSIMMLWFYYKIFRAVRKHCQHRELINGSHRSFSEKNPIHHSKTKDEQNICLQKQILDENTPPKGKQSSPQPKKMEAELHVSNPDKSSKAFVSKSNRKVLKLSCFPLATAQSEPGLDKAGKKCVCVTKENTNEEEPCSQDSDLSDASDNNTFTEEVPCKEHSNPNPERACSPQEKTENRDFRGLTYLRKTWQSLHTHSKRHIQGVHGNRERKAAKQLGVIMAVFMLCWIPYFVLFMVIACHGREQFSKLHMFTIWLGYVNSTLNPFLYPLCNHNFKKTFKKILHIH
ncbi:histamine H1 receptor [Gymnogyps californianus]|uniref:histamine H1 receptor n=1 Tax=Gymnogyps californianus TaxID=33616 RepID=UPI0021C621AB|nr:histamine H1 receptor [Gymnogyps californianus]XP_050760573.1 histamine H1 receptor [Gymnogyps californianus]XP_050760574.1 histamine H1 receptor [Gymnogyps californianus]XP_050760575.1 histamine H1 receptor [Gymnogyps californianus]